MGSYVAVHGRLGRLEEMGEEGFEAGLRRRCCYQLCGTLAAPGQVGEGAGGRVGVSFAIQSDGWGVREGEGRSQALTGWGQCSCGWRGGECNDLKLAGWQGGDRATIAATGVSKAQGPSSDAAPQAERASGCRASRTGELGLWKRC